MAGAESDSGQSTALDLKRHRKQNTPSKTMTTPTIHSHGTPGKLLYSDYENAMNRAQDAIDALNNATLNGRDYYPQGPDAFESAVCQRVEMGQKLSSVYNDLQTIATSILDQLNP